MGHDLSGAGGEFRASGGSLGHLLELAEAFGWEPAGTCPPWDYEKREPIFDKWDGNYFCNDWQKVTTVDAANVAQAIRRALDVQVELSIMGEDEDVLKARKGNAIRWLNLRKDRKSQLEWVRNFAEFCEAGEFYVG